jgi:hypothetical protein
VLLASTDEIRAGATAGEQADSFDQDRLAGPCLTGQKVEARCELDFEVLDYGEVSDT